MVESVESAGQDNFRQRVHRILHDRDGRTGRAVNFFLVFLILVSVAIVPLDFLPRFRRFDVAIHTIEAIIVGFFTVEYLLRIFSAPRRWKYIFSFAGAIDLLSIAPFYAGIFGTPLVRVLRLVRFLKLAEIEPGSLSDDAAVRQKGIGLVEGEEITYIITKHPLVLFFGCIPPILALSVGLGVLFLTNVDYVSVSIAVGLFIFALVFFWKAWLDYSYDVIYITNHRLLFHNQHILGRSVNQVNFHSITNVKPFYPSITSYIFRYGTLVIDTAAEHPGQITLHMVRHHEQAANCIMQKCFVEKETPAATTSP